MPRCLMHTVRSYKSGIFTNGDCEDNYNVMRTRSGLSINTQPCIRRSFSRTNNTTSHVPSRRSSQSDLTANDLTTSQDSYKRTPRHSNGKNTINDLSFVTRYQMMCRGQGLSSGDDQWELETDTDIDDRQCMSLDGTVDTFYSDEDVSTSRDSVLLDDNWVDYNPNDTPSTSLSNVSNNCYNGSNALALNKLLSDCQTWLGSHAYNGKNLSTLLTFTNGDGCISAGNQHVVDDGTTIPHLFSEPMYEKSGEANSGAAAVLNVIAHITGNFSKPKDSRMASVIEAKSTVITLENKNSQSTISHTCRQQCDIIACQDEVRLFNKIQQESHKVIFDSDGNSMHTCLICERVFVTYSAFCQHVATHVNLHNKCETCGKIFARRWLLKGHMRTHTGERPYTCSHDCCKKSFADRSNLRTHMLIHTATGKQYVCTRCNRSFAQKRYLYKHSLEVCKS